MEVVPHIILFIMLVAIVYQDFKFRAIHILLVFGVFLCAICILWLSHKSLLPMFYTSVFIGIVLLFLWIYTYLKERDSKRTLKNSIGLGDILFFFAVGPLFTLKNYLLFFISGMLVSLLFYLVFKNFMRTKFIPLAGILSFYLIVLKGISFAFNIDLFYQPISISPLGI